VADAVRDGAIDLKEAHKQFQLRIGRLNSDARQLRDLERTRPERRPSPFFPADRVCPPTIPLNRNRRRGVPSRSP
jgi:hypothetical protein